MSEVFATLASPNVSKGVGGATGIIGLISNIINGNRASGVNQTAIDQQKMVAELTKHPELLAAKIAALRQPLSQGLTQSVGNDVQGQLAERGLSSSPQIATAIESQALAPYEQHSQDQAIQAFLGTLGQGTSSTEAAASTIPGKSDTSGFWNLFQPSQGSSTPGLTDYGVPT